jgi:hypothetical protein
VLVVTGGGDRRGDRQWSQTVITDSGDRQTAVTDSGDRQC